MKDARIKYSIGDLVKMHEVFWDGKYGLVLGISPAEHDSAITAYYILLQMHMSPGWFTEESIVCKVE